MSKNPHFHRVGFCTERREDGAPCTLHWQHSGRHSYCGEEFGDDAQRWRKGDTLLLLVAFACLVVIATVFSGAIDWIIDRALDWIRR